MTIRQEKTEVIDEIIQELNEQFGIQQLTIEEAELVLRSSQQFLQQLRLASSNPVLVPNMKAAIKETDKEPENNDDSKPIKKEAKK